MSLSKYMASTAKVFKRDKKGSVSAELALAMPLLITILSGVIEAGNFLLLNMKLQHTTIAMADLATRDDEITEEVLSDIFTAVPAIMEPYSDSNRTSIILSAVSQTEDVSATVFWQRRGGDLTGTVSAIGEEGGAPTLPDILTLRDDETIIIAESFYQYEPLIFDVFGAQTLTKTSYFRPRLGSLQSIS